MVELILVACLFGIGSALAMSAGVPMTSQGSVAGQGELAEIDWNRVVVKEG